MNVSCPQCSTTYRVDPAKVPAGGVRARCSTCSGVIPVGMAAASQGQRTTPETAAPAVVKSKPAPPRPFAPSIQHAATSGTAIPRSPFNPPSVSTTNSPAVSVPPVTPPRVTPVAPLSTMPPASAPRSGTPEAPRPATPPAPAPATPPGPAAEKRHINPFLTRDPSLRAKRLARALVSDMVAYYPAKHSEGLEKGTLKELFREEIKKSYEEYVAQVGADFARTTTHFQESLNEVLGAGKKIF